MYRDGKCELKQKVTNNTVNWLKVTKKTPLIKNALKCSDTEEFNKSNQEVNTDETQSLNKHNEL